MPSPCRLSARVTSNRRTAADTFWLEFDAPAIAEAAVPGQFVMLGLGLDDIATPFLPRPFSVGWRDESGRIGLMIRQFGSGTHRLAALSPGEEVLLLGPLGRGFRWPRGRPVVCVAGGVGLAPFLFLAPEARQSGSTVSILYGEQTADRVFDPYLIEELTGVRPDIYTDDGTAGKAGRVVEAVEKVTGAHFFGCGPTAMLQALERRAREAQLPLQVSVEEHMGCGFGTCQGCVVLSSTGEWIKSCTDGPVFDREELTWAD